MTTVPKSIILWLSLVCVLIAVMVVVGGTTRLTGSGLSMVEWRPVAGILPPMDESQWLDVFEKYKKTPQFNMHNSEMDVDGFKKIFFWEYLHRVLGRLIGMVYFFPFLFFLIRKQIPKPYIKRLTLGFFLGGIQGLLGWYMVKSGLIDIPRVSHYRLAAHLSLAFLILGYLFYILLDFLFQNSTSEKHPNYFRFSLFLTFLVSLQIIYGAFMAGLQAGKSFNTFPDMEGSFIPDSLFYHQPWILNWFENVITIQFVHRMIAWVLLVLIMGLFAFTRKRIQNPRQRFGAQMLFIMVIFQFSLGVFTLLSKAPLELSIVHQLGALLLFVFTVFNLHAFSGRALTR